MSLRVQNIAKTIGGRKIVQDVSFKVESGEIIGILGPNGAGKSTTFYMTVGLIKPDKGQIVLNEIDISSKEPYLRAQMGLVYLPQESSIFQNMTVEDNLLIALEVKNKSKNAQNEKLNRLINEFSLDHIRHTKGIALSGGERRRVEIARCVAVEPSYILLDEPFAGVDPIAISEIKKLIISLKNSGIGILITDHNVKDALSIVSYGYVIYSGKVLASGTSDELMANQEVKQYYLGENFS